MATGQASMTVRFAVGDIIFEWDERKAVANRRKHGVTFEEAATTFLDPDARVFDDPDHSADEARFLWSASPRDDECSWSSTSSGETLFPHHQREGGCSS